MVYIIIDSEESEEIILKKDKAIMLFTASWCGPCKIIKPIYENLSNTYKTITFFIVDVDDRNDLTKNII